MKKTFQPPLQKAQDCPAQSVRQEVCDPLQALVRAAQSGDSAAVGTLCEQFSPLVYATAYRYRSRHEERDDLNQCGFEHLLRAIQEYDEAFGVYFAHFAKLRVRAAIYSYIRSAGLRRNRISGFSAMNDLAEKSALCERIADPAAANAFRMAEWADLFAPLSPRERLAIKYTVLGDESTSALAEREGVGRESAKTWRKRGLRKLLLQFMMMEES